jgi:hypothetical protein
MRGAHAATIKRTDNTGEVDTEHMLGFTEGSDIGEREITELEADSTRRFGRLGVTKRSCVSALPFEQLGVAPLALGQSRNHLRLKRIGTVRSTRSPVTSGGGGGKGCARSNSASASSSSMLAPDERTMRL